jgi:hypothetical protein
MYVQSARPHLAEHETTLLVVELPVSVLTARADTDTPERLHRRWTKNAGCTLSSSNRPFESSTCSPSIATPISLNHVSSVPNQLRLTSNQSWTMSTREMNPESARKFGSSSWWPYCPNQLREP